MKVLFIQGGTRCKFDGENDYYTDGNFNENVWKRYMSYCDNLTVFLRRDNGNYSKDFCEKKFNKIPNELKLVTVDDIYRPIFNYLNFNKRKKIKDELFNEIEKNDFIIIRSLTNFYTLTAIKMCKKLKKRYIVEVTGVAFDSLWYHGIMGKIFAIPIEFCKKYYLKNAPYALYVTEKNLQNRYPCNGKTIGCSDVEINTSEKNFYLDKLRNKKLNKKLIIGTLAWIDLKTKGHKDVIKAIYKLKKKGIEIEYQLVGAGKKDKIENIVKKYNLSENIKIIGAIPHDKVFKWLEELDVYIQPSYQEGLCRAIVEAMSVGCPVMCSNVGGNSELIDEELIFKKGNVSQIVKLLQEINFDRLEKNSKKNYKKSKEYLKEKLDYKRDNFYKNIIYDGEK